MAKLFYVVNLIKYVVSNVIYGKKSWHFRLSVMQKKYREFWQDFVVNVIKNVINCTQMTSINNIFNDISDQI